MHDDAHGVPVVETRALECPIVDAKTERLDEVQRTAGSGAQSRDVSGVGRNLGLDQNDMQRRVFHIGGGNEALFRL
jgi:hypothetical protein